MKKVASVLAVAAIAALFSFAAFASYDLTPADYLVTDFEVAVPEIVTAYTITPVSSISSESLGLLDLFFSDNQMLAWIDATSVAPITSWMAVDSLQYHAFNDDGTPKADRKLVTGVKRVILHLFFALGE